MKQNQFSTVKAILRVQLRKTRATHARRATLINICVWWKRCNSVIRNSLFIQYSNSILDSIAFFAENGTTLVIPYHYESSLSSSSTTAVGGASSMRTRRLAQETVTLSNSLPLSFNSSVFLRTADERLDVMKVGIGNRLKNLRVVDTSFKPKADIAVDIVVASLSS